MKKSKWKASASFSLRPLRIPDATKACRASGLFQFMARSFSRFVPNWFCCRYCNQIKSCTEKTIFFVAKVRLSAFEATPLKLDINSSAICVLSIKVYILTSNLAAVFYFRRARWAHCCLWRQNIFVKIRIWYQLQQVTKNWRKFDEGRGLSWRAETGRWQVWPKDDKVDQAAEHLTKSWGHVGGRGIGQGGP